jgi:segregation and condensation protein B
MTTMSLPQGGAMIQEAEPQTQPEEPIAPQPDASGQPIDAELQSDVEAPDGAVDVESADLFGTEKPGDEVSGAQLEALLFSTRHPLTAGNLGTLLGLASTKPIRRAIKALNDEYEKTGRTFRIEQVAGGYQMLTLPEFGETIKKLHQTDADAKLSKAALETLAIIAYKQPILRVDVEGIRGVACGETIRNLMEKHLVKIAGRAEEPGRPILYGTTKRFLEVFGLNSINDLPNPDSELRHKAKPAPESETDSPATQESN